MQLTLLFCLVIATLQCASKTKVDLAVSPISSDEYEVMSAALSSIRVGSRIGEHQLIGTNTKCLIISESTLTTPFPFRTSFSAKLPCEDAGIPDLQLATASSFQRSNHRSWPLEKKLTLKVPYQLIPKSEYEPLLLQSNHQAEWHRLFSHYEGCDGIVLLSRVGFNKSRDQAFLFFAITVGFDGESDFLVLHKTGGSWSIAEKIECFFSS